jgi:uncharacterized protein with PIN domain
MVWKHGYNKINPFSIMPIKQKNATFRFYEELNDFLPKTRRKKTFPYSFWGNPAVKDVIEAIGVPHTEVDLILVNGNSVNFDYHLQADDHVAVFPVFESFDIIPLIKLRPKPLRRTRFILDVHLGKLARLLRMLGFDSLYSKEYSDDQIRYLSVNEKRIILTRDQNLLKAKIVTHGYWLRSTEPMAQILEIVQHFDLKSSIKSFTRCLDCNGSIRKINKEKISRDLPARLLTFYQEFFYCTHCKKIYWPGSHFQKMKAKISLITGD